MTTSQFLRVSDFCRDLLEEDDDKQGVSVRVSLLLWLPNKTIREEKSPAPPRRKSCASVVRVSLAVLKQLQLQQDDVAFLSMKQHRKTAVRLELMEESEERQLLQKSTEHENGMELMAVCAPPIVATNLGVSPYTILQAINSDGQFPSGDGMFPQQPRPLSGSGSWTAPLQGDYEISRTIESRSPDMAKHVKLRPFGRSTSKDGIYKPLSLQHNGSKRGGGDNNSHASAEEHYKSGNDATTRNNEWIYPSNAANQSSLDERDHGDGSATTDKAKQVEIAVTDSHTTFELDSTPLFTLVPRLPPLHLQATYFERAFWNQNNSTQPQRRSLSLKQESNKIPPHPNLQQVAEALIHQPRASSSEISYHDVSTQILHVVGTEVDHDLSQCIESASHLVGYQCIHIRGLAAFAYNQGHSLRQGGGLIDQLSGLSSALEYIHANRLEPCVLHLSNVDAELNAVDQPLQQEQQDRFWVKLMDGINRYHENQRHSVESNKIGDRFATTPSLLVVLSTSSPLQPGPWMERLVFPSIKLSTPDDSYIRFLWNQAESNPQERNSELSEEIMVLLRGRSVQEIRTLYCELALMDTCTDGNTSSSIVESLQQICDVLDKGRRKATSTVSKISPVHWSDVGGLHHVRAEIMDAIELPLKHPHLFPASGGRSGILLFGPPGTGKTLVAKAVATECQLPFLSVKGPELLGSYVGESEANVRKVFASAREAASNNLPIPAAILFFDELDSLAPRRGGMDHGGGVMERVVASLLAELDGPSGSGNEDGDKEGRVFVLGATNRPDLLDPALLRPGRLDRLVYLGIATDDEERAKVLASQLQKMPLEGDPVEMARCIVSHLPPRLSGADLAKVSSGAMLNAVQRLCALAEEERTQQPHLTIDQILDNWGDERCTPIITMDDLLHASKECAPSISEEELFRYEKLRETIKQES
ncbi:cell division cycle protein 48 [Nitzschia inconspicua]|uniref:Peroxisomal ATPase PEX6 n=1 Tax=Nitzschia inconspicua TaxID=303405 RepID=A0A9K3L9Z9_9STRA|nr:cell division cycle protein 48 [Nitzschia inconspicua]